MKRYLVLFIIVLLVSLHLVAILPALRFPKRFLMVDSYDYLDLARNLLATGHYTDLERPGLDLSRPPVYPLLLAAGLVIGRGDIRWMSIVQVFISFIIAALLYHLGTRDGSQKSGILAAILYLANPNSAFWSLPILTETLTALWLTLALTALFHYWKDASRLWLGAAGLCMGLASLTRPVIFPLSLLWGGAILLLDWRMRAPKVKPLNNLAMYALGLAILVLPWQVRNDATHGKFSLVEIGGSTYQNWVVANTLAQVDGISRSDAAARIANAPNPLQYSLEIIRAHPLLFFTDQGRGVLRTLLGAEYGTWATALAGQDYHATGILSALLDRHDPSAAWKGFITQARNPWLWAGIYALAYDFAIFTLGLAGLARLWRSGRGSVIPRVAILVIISIVYLIMVPLAAGESRFRVPADPLLAWLGGWACLPRQT